MHEYIVKEISSYNLKKPTLYDKYLNKNFKMNDKLIVGKDVVLDFGNERLKVKLESIYKTNDTGKEFCISTSKFRAKIKAINKEG